MREMLKHFRQNWTYRLLAVILAVIVWLYVIGEQNPTGHAVIRVPLEAVNLREDLVVAESPTNVQVRVEGRRVVVESLLPRDIHAAVDLQNAQTGENVVQVQVEAPEGINIIDVNPPEVTIKVEKIEQNQLPVQVVLVGSPAGGYRALEPVIVPTHVLIAGSAGVLKNIGRAHVEVNIDQASGNYLAHLPVKLTNKEGQPLQKWYDITPPVIEVFVPVVRDMPSKTLPIRPQLVGEPAQGYTIKRIIVQPEIVEVFASYNELAEIDYISTGPVNISGARRQVIRETNLEIPAGVQISTFPRVRVIVEVGDT